jgi:site-specific DNA-adenine methylase
VEPFGGGASVLLKKAASEAEVYNDLDGDVVNLFRYFETRKQRSSLSTLVLLPLTHATNLTAHMKTAKTGWNRPAA